MLDATLQVKATVCVLLFSLQTKDLVRRTVFWKGGGGKKKKTGCACDRKLAAKLIDC